MYSALICSSLVSNHAVVRIFVMDWSGLFQYITCTWTGSVDEAILWWQKDAKPTPVDASRISKIGSRSKKVL